VERHDGYEANDKAAFFLGHAEGLGDLNGEAGELGVRRLLAKVTGADGGSGLC
jgi:hypothetical protein